VDQTFWNDAYKEDPESVMVADYWLAQELEGLPVGTALDLGCGLGTNALMLAEQGWSVVGVDWAEEAIELAKKAAQEKGLDATFNVGDITTWEPTDQFDLVISTYALPGGEDSKRTLQVAMKALVQGGTLLIAEWDKFMCEVWGFDEGDLLSPDEIVDLLPGLEIEKAEVRCVVNAFATEDDPRVQTSSSANVAFVRVRRP
jgi:SAM-dependent methyltransferase